MKRIVLLCICVLILTTGIANASVSISEIAWMGSAESQFGEWFELYNDGADVVNLAGWKLYEDSGAQLMFTFSKSIASKGYLLVERTTTSSPDPIPGINDESGTFGGSGFSNTGESLVLKDEAGSTAQILNFSSGWPAGDADTKQTMQWDGAKWITAPGTPKAPLTTNGGGEGVSSSPSSGTAWSAPRGEPHLELSVPQPVYTGVSFECSVKTFLEYEQAYTGKFLWNMGDGTVYTSTSPSSVSHIYQYPGTYTISFAYYKNSYDKKPFLFDSVERVVSSPGVSLSVVPREGISITNTNSLPIDISGWGIQTADGKSVLPPFTIIASKKTVLLPFSVLGTSNTITSATLETPEGTVLQVERQENAPKLSSVTVQPTEPIFLRKEPQIFDQQASAVESSSTTLDTKKNERKTVIVGLILAIVIGLFIWVERIITSRAQE